MKRIDAFDSPSQDEATDQCGEPDRKEGVSDDPQTFTVDRFRIDLLGVFRQCRNGTNIGTPASSKNQS